MKLFKDFVVYLLIEERRHAVMPPESMLPNKEQARKRTAYKPCIGQFFQEQHERRLATFQLQLIAVEQVLVWFALMNRGRSLRQTTLKRHARSDNATLAVGSPTEVEEEFGERRENCAHYHSCLVYAINKCWASFDCSNCTAYRLSMAEAKQAAEGISASIANARRG